VIEKKQNSYYMHLKGLQTSANWFSNLNTYQREEFKFISFTSGPVDPNPEQLQLPAATWNMLSWHGWAARGKKKNQAS
jgi:hypothetical protein